MNHRHCTLALGALLTAPALLVVGCESSPEYATTERQIEFWIEASNRDVVVGETVTVMPRSANTIGRDAEIDWSVSGGELKTEQDGRIARVKYDKPGRYTVKATLDVDGRAIDSESVVITVRPLS